MGQSNYSTGKKPSKNFDLSRGGMAGQSGPFVAEVMSTVDSTRSGRLMVWLKTFGNEHTKYDESTWIPVRYLSPYYGVTPHGTINAAAPDVEANGHAYGMWMNPPDTGGEVLVVFAEGDPNQGYYIGCIPTPQMNHMVPAIGAQETPHYNNDAQKAKWSTAARMPVTEVDKSRASMDDANYASIPKPIHSVLASQMFAQGVISDKVRGPITSSSQRESPSRVFGINTPGIPVYNTGLSDKDMKEGIENEEITDTSIVGRYPGHSFVMDDGNVDGEDKIVRIRTASGHQITLSDSDKSIYIVHANGNSWWELGAEGTIDMYAANSINMRSGGDINLHADNNVNINALEKVNLAAVKDINLEADKNLNLTGKKKLTAYSQTALGIKSDGTLTADAGSSASWKSAGHTEIKGATLGLNDGSAGSVTAPVALTQNNFPDVGYTVGGWTSEPGKFDSIVSRAPTHEPFAAHNTGVKGVKPLSGAGG